ncbi:MAG: zinc ribbon domain-containing protein [Ruminococcus sp.]|nr:zinc ribbon domain-containing protein [Ruminococcus sp.]
MQNFCHICGAELSPDEKFCPFCGEEIITQPQATNTSSTKSIIAEKAVKFKSLPFRDAIIGIVAVAIIVVFAIFIIATYIKSNTYEAAINSYLNILNGEGDFNDLKIAVGEEVLRTAADDYYDVSISDMKKGTERLISISAAAKETSDFKVTIKSVKELDDIDLLAYKRSKSDSYGQGFQIDASGGYEVEVVQSFDDYEEEKTFTVLKVGAEWCTYDALGLISDAVFYSQMSEDDYEDELDAYNGNSK